MTLPDRYYTDANLFEEEMERFFFSCWVAAGRADQILRPGDYFLRELLTESIIVVRSEEGAIRAFYNVCRHRGTRMCTEPAGSFSGRIQCPYHVWTYDLSGNLASAPHMEGTAGFSLEDYPLHQAGCGEWEGHLFINLSGKPRPLVDQLAGLTDKFGAWRMEELRLGARILYQVKANWKLVIQNYSECLHCPNLHPALQRISHYLSGVNEAARPNYAGGRMSLREGVETMSLDGKRHRRCLPGLSPEEQRRVYYYTIFPNLLLSLHPDYVMTHTLWPLSVGETDIICEFHFHPEEMSKPGFDPNDAVGFWDVTNRQDWHICELSQLGIQSRAYTPGPYSGREGLLAGLDEMFRVAEEEELP
jgi:Rieske 2Fe-2S family protein